MLYKFPLKENSKIPTVKNWPVHDYTRSVEESNCNYGVVCGYKSGIIVIDYDCYKENISLKINIDELKRIHGQYSYIVSTPSGGFHVYHKIEEKHRDWKNITGIEGFIDIRTTGGLPLQIKWISRLIEEFPQTWINKPIPNRELFENYEHFLPSGTSNMKSFGKLIEHMIKKYNLVGVTKIKTRSGVQWDIDRHIVYGWLTKNGFSDITELDPPIVNHYY